MNETFEVILWILGTLIGILMAILLGIGAWIRQHGNECHSRAVKDAERFGGMDVKLDRIILDIGDHGSGLRGQVHALTNIVSPLAVREQLRLERLSLRKRGESA